MTMRHRTRRIRLLLPIFLALGPYGFAAQSVQVGSGFLSAVLPNTAPWQTIGAATQPMRWEMRLLNWGAGNLPDQVIQFAGGLSISGSGTALHGGNGASLIDGIFNNGPGVAGCCTGHSDILVRIQRDAANQQYTLEIFDTATPYYASGVAAITSFVSNWSGSYALRINPGVQVAFVQWYSSVVPLRTPVPIAGTAARGDLGSWNFEGSVNDQSVYANNPAGGAVSYVSTPVYPPLCNAGPARTVRAGAGITLDGSASRPLDGGSQLIYLWQQLSGPSTLGWSSPATAIPSVSSLASGTYLFQLSVTDGSNQTSACSVAYSAVASDGNGVVITNNPAVDTLLGPIVRLGANPWPWYDDRHKAAANLQIANMDVYYGDYWNTAAPGTVTLTAGSPQVTGAGTTFRASFCAGGTTYSGAQIVVWYLTAAGGGQTGRRQYTVTGCADDTHLTLSANWDPDNVSSSLAVAYSVNDGTHAWDYNNAPANYYDNVAAFYNLYYRSGVVDYLNAARKLADRWWTSPSWDRGAACNIYGYSGGCLPWRSKSTLGLVMRALDGRPDMWPGLRTLWATDRWYIDSYLPQYAPGLGDVRENAYLLLELSYCALFDPDSTQQTGCRTDISNSFPSYWTPARQSDGSFPELYTGGGGVYNSWSAKGTSAILTSGSSVAAGVGNPWTSAMFTDCAGSPGYIGCPVWFTNTPTARPSIAGGDDPRVYYGTYLDANHITLHDANGAVAFYQGLTGTHGWATGDSSTADTVGWEDQPYAMGLLGFAFDMAARAVAVSDPAGSSLAHSYNVAVAGWIVNKGYSPDEKGLYYMSGQENCIAPVPYLTTGCMSDTESARVLNAEGLRGLIAAYQYNGDPALKAFIDTLYSAMWSKPGTGGPNPDGTYISAMDDGGFYMTGAPPSGAAPKYFGQFFGVTSLSNWPGARAGGLSGLYAAAQTVPPPVAPALSSPAHGATGVSGISPLIWGAVSGATSYDVYLGAGSSLPLAANVTGPTYSPPSLTPGTTYSWMVVANNGAGSSPASPVWPFTVQPAAPAAPALSLPANGATGVSTSSALSWGAVSGAASYDVYLGAGVALSLVANVTSTSYSPSPALTPGTACTWKVVAKNSGGSSPASPIWAFTVQPPAPAAPALSLPANGTPGVSVSPTLSWSAVPGAASYDVYFGPNTAFSLVATVATTSYNPAPPLVHGAGYTWKVVAKNSTGSSPASPLWAFTVQPPAPQITGYLFTPAPISGVSFSGTVAGSSFVSGTTVWFCVSGGSVCSQQPLAPVTLTSSVRLTIGNIKLTAGSWQMFVQTPSGQSARSLPFTVKP